MWLTCRWCLPLPRTEIIRERREIIGTGHGWDAQLTGLDEFRLVRLNSGAEDEHIGLRRHSAPSCGYTVIPYLRNASSAG